MWAKKCAADAADNNNADSEDADWRSLFREHFAPIIQYHKIAASVILEEIMPLGVVPDRDLLSALAYQVFEKSIFILDIEISKRTEIKMFNVCKVIYCSSKHFCIIVLQ